MHNQPLIPAVITSIPIVWLMVSLGWIRMSALKASVIGLSITAVIAVFYFNMAVVQTGQAVLEGILVALFPILWAIIGAVYAYNIGLSTGSIEQIKMSLSSISDDKRIQILILAWSFSAFLEGATGYGTAVAIPASIMVALGFESMFAAVLCLIGNTAPTAFGAIGIPTITLANLTGYSISTISTNAAIQLTPFIIFLPLVMVYLAGRGKQGLKGAWGVSLLAGISFAIAHYLTAKYIGPELPALLGGIVSLICIVVWVKVTNRNSKNNSNPLSLSQVKENLAAWSPYVILFIIIVLSSSLFPILNSALEAIQTKVQVFTEEKGKPVIVHWVLTPGSFIFISAILGGFIQGAGILQLAKIFVSTLKQLTKSIITICSIVAIAKVMSYSGMIGTLAVAISVTTGGFYPFLSPIIGAIGTFLTGSDTSSNVLFAQLQKQTALQLGINAEWIAAANTAGATAGKMLSPQNISIAAIATGLVGKEGEIFSKTIKICALYIILMGVFIFLTS